MSNKYRVNVGEFNLDFTFTEYVSQGSALNMIRDQLLSAINQAVGTSLNAGAVVTRLLSNRANIILVDSNYTAPSGYTNILRLTYDNWTYKLAVLDAQGVNLWSGAIIYFNSEKHLTTPIDANLKGKLVRFTYLGGTSPNTTRLVKVKDCVHGTLHGTDLLKGKPRQFKATLISKLEVVNV